jgi:hypothetical protein
LVKAELSVRVKEEVDTQHLLRVLIKQQAKFFDDIRKDRPDLAMEPISSATSLLGKADHEINGRRQQRRADACLAKELRIARQNCLEYDEEDGVDEV